MKVPPPPSTNDWSNTKEATAAPGEIKDDRRVVLDFEEPSDHEDDDEKDQQTEKKDLTIKRTVVQVGITL